MRLITLSAGLLAASALAATAGTTAAKLQLTSTGPVRVDGTGFTAGERVTVKVLQDGAGFSPKLVTATSTGRITARFLNSLDPCKGYVLTAAGSRGHRAMLRELIPPPCGIDPSP